MPSKILSKREQVTNELKRIIEMRGHNKFTRIEINDFISQFAFEFATTTNMVASIFDLAEQTFRLEVVVKPYVKPKMAVQTEPEDIDAILLAKPQVKPDA